MAYVFRNVLGLIDKSYSIYSRMAVSESVQSTHTQGVLKCPYSESSIWLRVDAYQFDAEATVKMPQGYGSCTRAFVGVIVSLPM